MSLPITVLGEGILTELGTRYAFPSFVVPITKLTRTVEVNEEDSTRSSSTDGTN